MRKSKNGEEGRRGSLKRGICTSDNGLHLLIAKTLRDVIMNVALTFRNPFLNFFCGQRSPCLCCKSFACCRRRRMGLFLWFRERTMFLLIRYKCTSHILRVENIKGNVMLLGKCGTWGICFVCVASGLGAFPSSSMFGNIIYWLL